MSKHFNNLLTMFSAQKYDFNHFNQQITVKTVPLH